MTCEETGGIKRRDVIKFALVTAATATPATSLCKQSSNDQASRDDSAVPDARLTAPLAVPASGEIKVGFLIADGAEVIDFAGPWGVFQYAMTDDNHHPFKLYTVAASTDPVTVSGGMTVLPNYTFADAPAPDVLVIPAMNSDQLAPATYDWLRSMHERTQVTMSVCAGAVVLAESGLLNGKNATTHHSWYGMLQAMYPKITVIRGARYVEDGRTATSGGLTSGMDLAMRVVERYFGRDVAKKTASSLEYQGTGWMYPQSNRQFAGKPVGTPEHPVDPVCEMQVSDKSPLTSEYRHKTYYFCSDTCKKHFVADPKSFITAA